MYALRVESPKIHPATPQREPSALRHSASVSDTASSGLTLAPSGSLNRAPGGTIARPLAVRHSVTASTASPSFGHDSPVAATARSIVSDSSTTVAAGIDDHGAPRSRSIHPMGWPCAAASATAAVHAGSPIDAKTMPQGSKPTALKACSGGSVLGSVGATMLEPVGAAEGSDIPPCGGRHAFEIACATAACCDARSAGSGAAAERLTTLSGPNARTNIGVKKLSSMSTGQRPASDQREISSRYVASSGTITTRLTVGTRIGTCTTRSPSVMGHGICCASGGTCWPAGPAACGIGGAGAWASAAATRSGVIIQGSSV